MSPEHVFKLCVVVCCVLRLRMTSLKFPVDDLRLFFTTFDSDDEVLPSDGRPFQSVAFVIGRPITISVFGNRMKLLATERGDATLTLTKRVCNVSQIEARKSLVRDIRRRREAINQGLEQLKKIRHEPSSSEQNVEQERQIAAHQQRAIEDCNALKHMWPLEPETGNEYHSWTLHKDDEGVTAIFLPDLLPGQEGRYIETRFWLGSASALLTVNMPAADVDIVPDCCAPYRPFNIPAVWREEGNVWTRSLV